MNCSCVVFRGWFLKRRMVSAFLFLKTVNIEMLWMCMCFWMSTLERAALRRQDMYVMILRIDTNVVGFASILYHTLSTRREELCHDDIYICRDRLWYIVGYVGKVDSCCLYDTAVAYISSRMWARDNLYWHFKFASACIFDTNIKVDWKNRVIHTYNTKDICPPM